MSKNSSVVQFDTLHYLQSDENRTLPLDTADWYSWLATASAFAFVSEAGSFTARKELLGKPQPGWYWKAYRKRAGKLYRAYLGKSEELTLARLQETAVLLAQREVADEPRPEVAATIATPLTVTANLPASKAVTTTATPLVSSTSSTPANLLATKLFMPSATADLISRPRLLERLKQARRSKLILVSAPPGFGKTSLVIQWLTNFGFQIADFGVDTPNLNKTQNLNPKIAWLSLDSADDQAGRFWSYFCYAFDKLYPGFGQPYLKLLNAAQAPSLQHIITDLLNKLAELPDEVTLVLDDYHVITNPGIQQDMGFLLEHLPPQLRLVITSRVEPVLPLARLRARGQLTEIRADDLRFTVEEATAFLNQAIGLKLSVDEVAALEARTEGWIAALQLAALSMQNQTDVANFIANFSGTHRVILEFLAEEVLRQQSDEVRNFLLQTSILDRLTAPLAEAITGCADGQMMLDFLKQHNLFLIPLDQIGKWYRYHHLFGEYLRSRLQQEQAEHVPLLYRWTARWYEEQQMLVEATEYALAGEDFEQADRLINQLARSLVERGELRLLISWLEKLPPAMTQTQPQLALTYGTVLLLLGRLERAEYYGQQAEQAMTQTLTAKSIPETIGQLLSGQILALYAHISRRRNNFSRSIELSERALALLPPDDLFTRCSLAENLAQAYLATENLPAAIRAFSEAETLGRTAKSGFFTLGAIIGLVRMQIQQGRLRLAANTCYRALQLSEWQTLPLMGEIHLALAGLLREANELVAAEEHLERGRKLVALGGDMGILFGYLELARLAQATDKLDLAFGAIEQAVKIGSRSDNQNLTYLIERAQMRLWLASHNEAAAEGWAQYYLSNPDTLATYQREMNNLMLARLRLAQAKPESALNLLATVNKTAQAAGRISNLIESLALQALAYAMQNSQAQALRTLTHTLALVEPEGYLRLFVEEGGLMLNLLKSYQQSSTSRQPGNLNHYVTKILAAFKPEVEQTAANLTNHELNYSLTTSKIVEGLTEREAEVLRLLTTGLTSFEIAEQLVIAVSTVRSHIKNIYSKLNVQNRGQAVARARELNLL